MLSNDGWCVVRGGLRTDSYGGPLVCGRSASALTSLVYKGSARARSSPRRLTRGLAACGRLQVRAVGRRFSCGHRLHHALLLGAVGVGFDRNQNVEGAVMINDAHVIGSRLAHGSRISVDVIATNH